MAFIPQTSYAIAAYASGSAAVQNVEADGSGNYAAPKFLWKPYTKPTVLGDGTVRGAGWAEVVWSWDVMTETQRNWLRAFCPAQSADVWIKTPTFDNSGAFVTYHAVMVWPTDSEERDAKRRVKFQIKFQRLTST